VRTLDIRLLSGNTAVHADMLMWHPEDPVESAALQLINVLFAVPQISVKLDRLPADHVKMIAYWLAFWREYRSVLLNGRLEPYHPELLYPLVVASDANKRIAVVYHRTVLTIDLEESQAMIIVNGTRSGGVYIELMTEIESRTMEIKDCMGNVVESSELRLSAGIHALEIPPAGVMILAAGRSDK